MAVLQLPKTGKTIQPSVEGKAGRTVKQNTTRQVIGGTGETTNVRAKVGDKLIPPVKTTPGNENTTGSVGSTTQTQTQAQAQTQAQTQAQAGLSRFRSTDGTYQEGYYGQDENGDYGYYADQQHTTKLANGNWGKSSAKTFSDFYGMPMPDLSRNEALAGMTVYDGRGNNVTYDENGYAVSSVNLNNIRHSDTLRGVSKDAVLNKGSESRAAMGGSTYDQLYFTDYELGQAAQWRKEAEQGLISWETANQYVESIRAKYGYSGGSDGSGYYKVTPKNDIPDEYKAQNVNAPTTPGLSYMQPQENATPGIGYTQTQKNTSATYPETYRTPGITMPTWSYSGGAADYSDAYRQLLSLMQQNTQQGAVAQHNANMQQYAGTPYTDAVTQHNANMQQYGVDRDNAGLLGNIYMGTPYTEALAQQQDAAAQWNASMQKYGGSYGVDRDNGTPYTEAMAQQNAVAQHNANMQQYAGPSQGAADVPELQRSESDAMAAELRALYNGENGPYAQAMEAYRAAQTAAAERAVNQLEGQKSDVEAKYADLYRQLYRDSMNSRKNLDQYLAAQGITGGAAESTRLGYATSYADALRKGEQSRISELGSIDRAISDARLSGDLSGAQMQAELSRAQADNYASVLQALMNRGDTLAAQDWSRQYQLGRDAISDQRYADELGWNRAYQLGRDAISDQRYADELGWNRSYQLGRDAISDQRYADELGWNRSYQLGRDAISDERYADELGWNRSYQLARDAISDTRYNNQWSYQQALDDYNRRLQAYQLAYEQQQDAYNRELQAYQLGYNREQDAYSRQLQEQRYSYEQAQNAYEQQLQAAELAAKLGDYSLYEALGFDVSAMRENPGYTPTFSVAQLQKEVEYARKHGTALSPTAAKDYEYYYGAPYGGYSGVSSGVSGSVSGVSSGYDNGGLSNEDVKAVQRAWNAAHPDQKIAVDGYWGPNSQSVTGFRNAGLAQKGLSATKAAGNQATPY